MTDFHLVVSQICFHIVLFFHSNTNVKTHLFTFPAYARRFWRDYYGSWDKFRNLSKNGNLYESPFKNLLTESCLIIVLKSENHASVSAWILAPFIIFFDLLFYTFFCKVGFKIQYLMFYTICLILPSCTKRKSREE